MKEHRSRKMFYRLKGYNYSSSASCFVAMCVKDKECLFGSVIVGVDLYRFSTVTGITYAAQSENFNINLD